MKKITIIVSVVAAALFTTLSHGQVSDKKSATKSAANNALGKEAFSSIGCASCHDATSRVVGPSLHEIAQRYKGKKVVAEIAARIRNGSDGRWGELSHHPAYEGVDEKTARLMAAWILAGSPQ